MTPAIRPYDISISGHTVHVTPRRNARRITLRRDSLGNIKASVPYGMDSDKSAAIIATLLERLPETKPGHSRLAYSPGQTITCPDTHFNITVQDSYPNSVVAHTYNHGVTIGVGSSLDFNSDTATALISRMLCKAAFAMSQHTVLPQARQKSISLGVYPKTWETGRGMRTLGTCHADGRISLSCLLVFLPLHLRDYVICHELAHLSEMNHSARFHALCNSYCHGMEKELKEELRRFKWPILR